MIYIDFQGGAHGHFLEFVCNTLLFGMEANETPFNKDGASHDKGYKEKRIVKCNHYFQQDQNISNSDIISIRITPNDLLPLTMVSLVCAGNYNIIDIHKDTFNKFNNIHYKSLLNNLIDSYSNPFDSKTYNIIKDPSWPDVSTLTEFYNLPLHILNECIDVHGYYPFELSEASPDCPVYVLRDFFKRGFLKPQTSGFITAQKDMEYLSSNRIYHFPYSAFYNTDRFVHEINNVAFFLNVSYNKDRLIHLHKQFLDKQSFKDAKHKCDAILDQIYNNNAVDLSDLDLLEEAYIEAKLEEHYGIKFPFVNNKWLTSESLASIIITT